MGISGSSLSISRPPNLTSSVPSARPGTRATQSPGPGFPGFVQPGPPTKSAARCASPGLVRARAPKGHSPPLSARTLRGAGRCAGFTRPPPAQGERLPVRRAPPCSRPRSPGWYPRSPLSSPGRGGAPSSPSQGAPCVPVPPSILSSLRSLPPLSSLQLLSLPASGCHTISPSSLLSGLLPYSPTSSLRLLGSTLLSTAFLRRLFLLSRAPQASQFDGAGCLAQHRGLSLQTCSPPTAKAPGTQLCSRLFSCPEEASPNLQVSWVAQLSATMDLF